MGTECKLKTHDLLLLVSFVILSGFGIMAFFWIPKDTALVAKIVDFTGLALTNILSFKFGVHQAQVQPGTIQQSVTAVPADDKEKDKLT